MAVWLLVGLLAPVRGEVLAEQRGGESHMEAAMRVAGRGGDAVVLDAHAEGRAGMVERGMRGQQTSEASGQMGKRLEAEGNCLKNTDLCVCTCAKCGSTSLYSMIYEGVMGKKFVNCKEKGAEKGACDIYAPEGSSPKMAEWLNEWETGWHPTKDSFNFAVVRDPVKRLISAFRSKFACETGNFKTDWDDRAKMVPKLLEMAGVEGWQDKKCLSADEYVDAVYTAHQKADLSDFNDHILPQTENCFREGREYSLVCELGDQACFQKLAAKLPHKAEFPHTHEGLFERGPKYWATHPEEAKHRFASKDVDQDEQLFQGLDKKRQWKLLEITKAEFQKLKGYLHKSRIGRK